jgi:hypothetical protein
MAAAPTASGRETGLSTTTAIAGGDRTGEVVRRDVTATTAAHATVHLKLVIVRLAADLGVTGHPGPPQGHPTAVGAGPPVTPGAIIKWLAAPVATIVVHETGPDSLTDGSGRTRSSGGSLSQKTSLSAKVRSPVSARLAASRSQQGRSLRCLGGP